MKTCLLTLGALLSVAIAHAQTAEEIVAKHIDAVGGKDKLSQITSIYMESSTEAMGNQSPTITQAIAGKGFKSETDFNGQKIVQVVTDKGGWAINPFSGGSDPAPMPDDQYKNSEDQVYLPDPLFNYAEHGAKVELQGQEKIGTVNAYKLKYTNKDKSETTFFLDPATWYVIQAQKKGNAMGQEVTITSTMSDYRKTDQGLVFPYAANIDMGQFALKVTVSKVEINKTIDPAVFEMGK